MGAVARAGVAEPLQRLRLDVTGAVQGVGFRPFVHRLATEEGLCGLVRNTAAGATVEVEGPAAAIDPRPRPCDHGAHVRDAAHHRRQLREGRVDRLREQPREGRLAHARRPPQHHRGQVPALHHARQRPLRTDQV